MEFSWDFWIFFEFYWDFTWDFGIILWIFSILSKIFWVLILLSIDFDQHICSIIMIFDNFLCLWGPGNPTVLETTIKSLLDECHPSLYLTHRISSSLRALDKPRQISFGRTLGKVKFLIYKPLQSVFNRGMKHFCWFNERGMKHLWGYMICGGTKHVKECLKIGGSEHVKHSFLSIGG